MNALPPAYGWLDDLSPLPRMMEEARKLFGTFEVAGPASNPLILDWAKEVGLASGAWARAIDLSTWDEHVSAYLFVEQGTVNADVGYLCTVDVGGTLGTTAVIFVQFNGAGQIVAGNGLTKTGNTIDVGAGTGIAVAADAVALTGQALALHNLGTNGIIARTASGTVAARTLTAGSSKIAITNGDGVAGKRAPLPSCRPDNDTANN